MADVHRMTATFYRNMVAAAAAAGKRERKTVDRLVEAPAPVIKKAAKKPKAPAAKKSAKKSPAKKEKKEKVPRAPSAYNLFMKSELAKVKKADPSLDHKAAFTAAAGNWASSKSNPKNKK